MSGPFMTEAASSDATAALPGEPLLAVEVHMWWLPDRSLREMHRSMANLPVLRQRPDERGLLHDQRREHSRSFPRTRRLHIWSCWKQYFESVPRTFAERPRNACSADQALSYRRRDSRGN